MSFPPDQSLQTCAGQAWERPKRQDGARMGFLGGMIQSGAEPATETEHGGRASGSCSSSSVTVTVASMFVLIIII